MPVGINGYGVIGKRVADAIARQDIMALVGVADVIYDCQIRVVAEHGYQTPNGRIKKTVRFFIMIIEHTPDI